ncbi:MAG: rhodanese-like domain-containing protein [Sandaracinaceae bacterium]|nr:rhodanese-like domain-containing protein [Sandaracinaceae bacterium]
MWSPHPKPRTPTDAWAPITRAAGVPEVSAAWTRAHAGEVVILDVRERAELLGELGAIDGVVHLPLGRLAEASARYAPDTPLVIVCRSGARSGAAATALERAGFTRVASMQGGMLAWRADEAGARRATRG